MKKYYTNEEIQLAKSADIIEVLQKLGQRLRKCGKNEYCLENHDSLKISNNMWCWNSRGKVGGNVIDFLMGYDDYRYSFTEAVGIILELTGREGLLIREEFPSYASAREIKRRNMVLPIQNKTNNRVIAYLNKTRGIDYQIILDMIKQKKLYEDSVNHNAVFIGYDKEGAPRYGFKRGTATGAARYAGDLEDSDKSYGFNIEGSTDTVYVFEAPIDVLSYLTIKKYTGKVCNDHLLSLGGASETALDRFLSETHGIRSVIVCTDNDKAGIACGNRINSSYGEKYSIEFRFPTLKDYNEDLLEMLKKTRS